MKRELLEGITRLEPGNKASLVVAIRAKMPKKIKELKKMLQKAGFERIRIRGSHERWIHPDLPELPITLAGKDSQDAKPYLEKLVNTALNKLDERD